MKAESTQTTEATEVIETKVDKVSVGIDVSVAGNGFRFFVSHETKDTVRHPSPQPQQIEDNQEHSHGNERR
jgi:hypothetical protein